MVVDLVKGQWVCIVGYGLAGPVHSHERTVQRVTREYVYLDAPGVRGQSRRYRRTTRTSVGRTHHGYTVILDVCQRQELQP